MATTSSHTTKVNISKKPAGSSIGAPSQRKQSTRKGKRAWRKNVDLDDVEEALEEARTEERVVGSRLHERKDGELFQVDTTGDEKLRKALPRFNPRSLTSARILAQRSAVPAVTSRTTPSTTSGGKRKISNEEKERLLRIGKRARKGPFNSYQDEMEFGKGSAMLEVSAAVKQSGKYNVWDEVVEEVDLNVPEVLRKQAPKPPRIIHPKASIALTSISDPHQGTSYNPTVESHGALLAAAASAEEQRHIESARLAGVKEKITSAVTGIYVPHVPLGMTVDNGEGAEEEEEVEGGVGVRAPHVVPKPKTKQQRAKKLKLLEEKRALAHQIENKRMLASIASAKSMRRTLEKGKIARAKELAERDAQLVEKLRGGLAGTRLGRHRVATHELDVQLGEDLAESLRELKPEGNLFRDRFFSLQQRGLVEPRVLVLGKRREARTKEYEKHAWKRFE